MRLSLQLYTLRDALSDDLDGTLAKVAAMGVPFVEIAGMYDRSAVEWADMLAEHGLQASGSHIGLDQLESNLEDVISDAKAIGFDLVILPWIGESYYQAGWGKFGERLIPIGQKLKDAGLKLAYHNHAFEFTPGAAVQGFDELYSSTPSDVLYAELDLAWVQIGGQDPVAYVNKLGSRVAALHCKDYDPVKTPQWVPAGQGKVDLKSAIAAAEANGVKFGAIELDESPGDPVAAVGESAKYLQGLGLK